MAFPRMFSVLPVLPVLAACAGFPAALPARAAAAIGDLACIQAVAAAAGAAQSADLPPQCPVLVVGADAAAGTVRVLGAGAWDSHLPAAMARPYAKADLPGTLLGATEKPLSRMAPSPNPGVMKSVESFGLIVSREGRVDTLAPDEWPNLHRVGTVCGSLAACLDSLGTSPLHGLLQGPFLPRIAFQVRPGPIATFESGRPGKASQAGGTGTFAALARPSPGTPAHRKADPAWTWALADFPADRDTARQAWIWSVARGRPQVLRVAPGDPFEVRSVVAEDLDRDGHPDLIAETVAYTGDGSYSDLHFFHGNPAATRPGYAVLSLSGGSGEPGGSDVAGDWWAAPPRIYRVTAAKGNDAAPEATHDLRIEASLYTRAGSLKPAPEKAFTVLVFGTPGPRSAADSLAKRLAEAGKERIDIRPLPRAVGGRLLWQAGAVAPDAAAARRWARRDPAAEVLRIPAVRAAKKEQEGWKP